MKHKYLVGAALLLCAGAAVAQVYKWVDAKGVTHFSDQPPPEQKNVQVKSFSTGASTVDLPYEVAEAVRNAPVTLFTTTNCPACDQARSMLQARGIPYTERSVTTQEDVERLRAAGGNDQLPFMTVGRNRKLSGYESGAWNAALTAAQYPERRALPSTYQFAKAEPAAPPPPPPAAAAAPAPAQVANTAPKLPPKPDFQF